MPRVAWVLAAALALCGCYHPPAISGHHWHCSFIGCNLFDSNGVMVAAFTEGIESARGCIYIGAGTNCVDFESDRLALGYIDRTMRKIDGDDDPAGCALDLNGNVVITRLPCPKETQ